MILFSKVRDVKDPSRGTHKSAGIDFFVPNDFTADYLEPGQRINIPSGVKANVPAGFMLCAFNKSGVASKKGLLVGACVVDEDYQGEIHLNMFNAGEDRVFIEPGDKIVQFILVPVNYAEIRIVPEQELFVEQTERGAGGFGSTGVK